jgi:hypothetical protein
MTLVLVTCVAASANAGSERHGYKHPKPPKEYALHRHKRPLRARVAYASWRSECLAKCKSNYEIDVEACKVMERPDRKECRARESETHKLCSADCRAR